MLKARNRILIAAIGISHLAAPPESYAQIEVGSASGKNPLSAIGNALSDALKPMIEAMMKINNDMLARRLVFDPETKTISSVDTVIAVTIKNTHYDTAHFTLKLVAAPPEALDLPKPKRVKGSLEAAQRTSAVGDKPKRSMVAEEANSADTAMVNYKDLSNWVSYESKDTKLAPGETKTILVKVKAPSDLAAGLYATWLTSIVSIGPNTYRKVTAEEKKELAKVDQSNVNLKMSGPASDPNLLPEGAKISSSLKIVLERK